MGPNLLQRRTGICRYNKTSGWVSTAMPDREIFARSSSGVLKGNFSDPNPWTYQIHTTREAFGSCDWYYSDGIRKWEEIGFLGGGFAPALLPIAGSLSTWYPSIENFDSHYQAALDRLNEKVRGSLDISVALGELGSTARMIRSCLTFDGFVRRLDGLYRSERRRMRVQGSAYLKRPADVWLEYTYGWKPLISDIYSAADESVRYSLNRLQRVSASYVERLSDGAFYSSVPNRRYPFKRTGVKGVKLGLVLDVPSSRFDIARWTSLNPASIAWELMPYSFVVDWFYDIGGALRSFETALAYGSRFKTGYRSNFVYGSHRASLAYDGPYQGTRLVYTGVNESNLKYFSRTKLLSYPFPRPPSFEVKMGWRRLLSSAALLAQFLK